MMDNMSECSIKTFWESTKRESLSENIVNQIINAVKSGRIKPGVKMPGEVELANMFGVSRNSIREALNVLSWIGMLEKKQGSGTHISERAIQKIINYEFVELLSEGASLVELTEIRMTLDSQIAYWVAERASAEDIEKLENIVQRDRVALDSGEIVSNTFEEPSLFHRTLANMCGNRIALKFFESIASEIIQSRKIYYIDSTDQDMLHKRKLWNQSDHEKILKLIKDRNPLGAQRAMYQHLFSMLMQIIES
ncbi:MAG: FadR/GntR family transcriptional regulator [Smithellaceae bacterium]